MRILAWMGRQRGPGIAALVLISILTPALGTILRPFVTEAVFALLVIAFVRMDANSIATHLRSPWQVAGIVFWCSVLLPYLLLSLFLLCGIPQHYPDLYKGLILQAAASPMMATPAIVSLMGFESTLVLLSMLASTLLVPLTASILILVSGVDLALSPFDLGWKLLLLITVTLLLGLLLRRIIGPANTRKFDEEISGLNFLILFVFISAVTGQLGIRFISDPLLLIGLTATAFSVFAVLFGLSFVVFKSRGYDRGFSLALMTSQRNMGLMIAATGGILPDITWLYFAVSQFPLYFAPLLLAPLATRIQQKIPTTRPQ